MPREIPEGLHARYEHCRNYQLGSLDVTGVETMPLNSRGGTTCCYLEDEDNKVVARGYAQCSPSDQYNKSIGRAISLGRALKEYEAREQFAGATVGD